MTEGTIGFTGTREGLTNLQVFELARLFVINSELYDTFIHGDCIGADADADHIAYSLGYAIKMRPCTLESMRAYCRSGIIVAEPMPPLERNKLIVGDSNLMIACPKEMKEVRRSGTWATIRHSIKMGTKLVIIYPDGSLEVKND
jgi:hypothetical protein